MNKQEAVRIWEDNVADSGNAPTDEELLAFALAVAEKTREPFVRLSQTWKERGEALKLDADDLRSHDKQWAMRKQIRSNAYTFMAHALDKTIYFQKLFSGEIVEPVNPHVPLSGRFSVLREP